MAKLRARHLRASPGGGSAGSPEVSGGAHGESWCTSVHSWPGAWLGLARLGASFSQAFWLDFGWISACFRLGSDLIWLSFNRILVGFGLIWLDLARISVHYSFDSSHSSLGNS